MLIAEPNLSLILESGATLVTSSRVLASVASEQFAREKLSAHVQGWIAPKILPVKTWLEHCWREARLQRPDSPLLLSPAQERVLWQGLIEETYPHLFDPEGAARMAVSAAETIAEWKIPPESPPWHQYGDAEQFQRLFLAMQGYLRERNWITRADVWHFLPEWIDQGLYLPDHIVLLGFEAVSPALEQVLRALGSRATIREASSFRREQPVQIKQLSDLPHQFEFAGRWARKQLERKGRRSIAVFVPGVRSHRTAIERIFRKIFYPGADLHVGRSSAIQPDNGASPFHIDASGDVLAEPLIRSAVLLLELGRPRIAISDASAILRCSFIRGAAEERSLRALADVNLRRDRDIEISFGHLERQTANCPLLGQVWKAVRSLLHTGERKLEFSEWSEFFGALLNAVGWPGDDPLSAQEQTLVDVWDKALGELDKLSFVSGRVSFSSALSKLRSVLQSSPGPQIGDWNSPIQILDVKDAAGLRFDCALVVGLSEQNWSRPSGFTPFIPPQLQRDYKVPGATGADSEAEDQLILKHLFGAAPVIFGTFSGRPLPAAREFLSVVPDGPPVWNGALLVHSYPVAAFDTPFEDGQAPQFSSNGSLTGGVGIIKSQSQCPFRAFAEFRLKAQRPEDACFGLDARERGGYLHRALENVWRVLQDSTRLQQTDPDTLAAIVEQAVKDAVEEEEHSPFHSVISRTEQQRLQTLVFEWLTEWERVRPTPFRVEHMEEKRSVEIAGLQLRLRVDRIDRLNDGSVVLIDYKSGQLNERSLLGERPSEPQLLIYAAAVEEEVDGIFLAQVKARDLRAIGCATRNHFPSPRRSKLDWATLRDSSRDHLRSLAEEFLAGYASVLPQPGACNYCNLMSLCRLKDGKVTSEDDDAAD